MAIKNKLKKEISSVKEEARNKIAGYIVAAFGLVAGLAWNDAIKSLIEWLFPLKANGVLAKFIYAVAITLIMVFISIYVVKILKGREKKESKNE